MPAPPHNTAKRSTAQHAKIRGPSHSIFEAATLTTHWDHRRCMQALTQSKHMTTWHKLSSTGPLSPGTQGWLLVQGDTHMQSTQHGNPTAVTHKKQDKLCVTDGPRQLLQRTQHTQRTHPAEKGTHLSTHAYTPGLEPEILPPCTACRPPSLTDHPCPQTARQSTTGKRDTRSDRGDTQTRTGRALQL